MNNLKSGEISNKELFLKAARHIPGGVNSPVRACKSVGMDPLFIASGKGSTVKSLEGDTYIDYVQSWGPLLLGHASPSVVEALHSALELGTSFGAPCRAEVDLAELVCRAMPHVEMVRMVNSGTEATMSALRLARAYTKKDKFIKFIGGYHGHGDMFLSAAGSGLATLGIPSSPGVPEAVIKDTILLPYNDLSAAMFAFEQYCEGGKGNRGGERGEGGEGIAAVIVEPVAGNMGLVLPQNGFLKGLRELCSKHGALLVFDEVITGFRVSYGGASERFGVIPDLVTLGKIIGGGLPVGAFGGKREIMEMLAPLGSVYQAGTLSGNPLAMNAGIATLTELTKKDYPALERRVEAFCQAAEGIFRHKGVDVQINRIASMFTIFFTREPVFDFASASKASASLYAAMYKGMRAQGVLLAPSAFECAMVSFAHEEKDFEVTLEALEKIDFDQR